MSHIFRIIVPGTLLLCVLTASHASAQRSERRKARVAESAEPKTAKGGVTFQVDLPLERVYDTLLNYLKREGNSIDVASKETGQIITGMEVSGGYSQTGTRTQIIVIKDAETQTSVRVAVTEQKRKKLLQTEPWSDPKVNDSASAKVADLMKAALSKTS